MTTIATILYHIAHINTFIGLFAWYPFNRDDTIAKIPAIDIPEIKKKKGKKS